MENNMQDERTLLSEIEEGKSLVKRLWLISVLAGSLMIGAVLIILGVGLVKFDRGDSEPWSFLTDDKRSRVADDLLYFLNVELPAKLPKGVDRKSAIFDEVSGFLQRQIKGGAAFYS
jgi:hypothetical protein